MNSDNIKIGFAGEQKIREYLMSLRKDHSVEFGQIDIVANIDNKWYSIEVKKQEAFEPPPFKGHGLPPWQIKFRISLFKERNIIPLLFIVDKKTDIIYYNSIIELEKGDKFLTKTGKRIIYPIDSFKVLFDPQLKIS